MSFHSTIGRSPFEALYERAPRHFSVSVHNLEQWLQERQVMNGLIIQQLHRAFLCMKQQLDKGRSERQFEVGDLFFLKL
jgi:hypothetical protein